MGPFQIWHSHWEGMGCCDWIRPSWRVYIARDLPIRTKHKLHAIGGARGMWSLPIHQTLRGAGMPSTGEQDALILSTTIGAAPFFQKTAILHVTTGNIRVLEPDGTERQTIKDTESKKNPSQAAVPGAHTRACSISDPFIWMIREDDLIGLFIGEPEQVVSSPTILAFLTTWYQT
ncbi:hypothetical protein D9758_013995 [Tetrapyrgos nigripes]|uniref:Uncharacterized protein n=1 Tax=Tetrapyrgos nigripes TaxID=182062 RepID=A0A8H5G820_9AGAR|nr:hypothetical protein D9758_013995 [Tetrapyrgos nigripes]